MLTRLAEGSQDLAIQIHLVDATLVGVGGIKHLVGTWGDADGPGGADIGKRVKKFSIAVKDLDAVVFAVAHIDVAIGVGGDGVRMKELTILLKKNNKKLIILRNFLSGYLTISLKI